MAVIYDCIICVIWKYCIIYGYPPVCHKRVKPEYIQMHVVDLKTDLVYSKKVLTSINEFKKYQKWHSIYKLLLNGPTCQ